MKKVTWITVLEFACFLLSAWLHALKALLMYSPLFIVATQFSDTPALFWDENLGVQALIIAWFIWGSIKMTAVELHEYLRSHRDYTIKEELLCLLLIPIAPFMRFSLNLTELLPSLRKPSSTP